MTTSTVQTELAPFLDARDRTDYEIPPKWVWAAVGSYVTWAAVVAVIAVPVVTILNGTLPVTLLTWPIGLLGLAGLMFSAASSYLVYQLISRRNMHFAREEALLWKILDNVRSRTPQSDMRTLLPLSSAERDLIMLSMMGKERSAVLWSLLAVIPYVGWFAITYALAFLSHDLRKHEQMEDMVLEDMSRVATAQGGQSYPIRPGRMPRQTVPLYLVFSIITLGIFPLVWLYFSVKDPESHFEYHRSVEAILASTSASLGPSGGL